MKKVTIHIATQDGHEEVKDAVMLNEWLAVDKRGGHRYSHITHIPSGTTIDRGMCNSMNDAKHIAALFCEVFKGYEQDPYKHPEFKKVSQEYLTKMNLFYYGG